MNEINQEKLILLLKDIVKAIRNLKEFECGNSGFNWIGDVLGTQDLDGFFKELLK